MFNKEVQSLAKMKDYVRLSFLFRQTVSAECDQQNILLFISEFSFVLILNV